MDEFSPLSLSDGEDHYGLNHPVLLLPDKEYSCIGEYSYENLLIKSESHSFKIECGELLNRQVWFKVCIFACFYHPFNLSQQLVISTQTVFKVVINVQ